jgi:hypothetical protein
MFYKNYEASADENNAWAQLSVRPSPIGKTGRTIINNGLQRIEVKERG